MQHKVPSNQLAATVAHLSADIDALDRGVVDAGVIASTALAKADRIEQMLAAVVSAAGLDEEDTGSVSYSDPVSTRLQARKRRIQASGLTIIRGGRS